MSEVESVVEMVCLHCAKVFTTASAWGTRLCSEDCRVARTRARYRAKDLSRRTNPVWIRQQRTRNARWCVEHRGCKTARPWLSGAPAFSTHLPGATMAVTLDPVPKWPIILRNTRGLHGAMTTCLGVGHLPSAPYFALRMTDLSPSGWAVHWWTEDGARLAGTSIDGDLYGRKTRFTFGPAFRFRAPTVAKRGHGVLRVETVTPITIVSTGRTSTRTVLTADNLLASLSSAGVWRTWMSEVDYLREEDKLRMEIVKSRRDEVTRTDLGGKYGVVPGWEGSILVEANAPARWMLKVAGLVGIGSRTAFGFGQIRVTEVE